ncbi:MAG TPA: cation:proton antiporter, partial [Candidatus Acidoferrales bacterium]|nr:cation:proton antiporter [Candidatus Acidoferrales bacterium]
MRQADEILTVFIALVPLLILARRAHIAYPIVLVLGGIVIGFVPGLPTVQFDPDFILVAFLPPLLYWAALTAPVHEIARNGRAVALLAVVLVFVTIAAVAWVAHAALGLAWPVAIVLGAIVAPTDEVAAAAIAEDLGVSRSIVATIEGESLLNDAAALVTYRIAIAAVVVGMPSPSEGVVRFVGAAVGGIVLGLIVGYVATSVRRRLHDLAIDNTVSLLTPFLAYIPADALGLSGVLATVSAGLHLARAYPTAISSHARL